MCIKELLYNTGAPSYKNTTPGLQIIGPLGGMPYLSSLRHIYDVIIVAPKVSHFIFKPAIIYCKKRITTTKSVATAGRIYDILIKVIQS